MGRKRFARFRSSISSARNASGLGMTSFATLSALLRQQHDLAGDALGEHLESLGVAAQRQSVRDDRPDVEAFAQQCRGLVPGLPELAAGNAVDAYSSEDDRVVEVECD